ncbi:MAG: hypothetical protein WA081_13840 [Desulfosalsimonadaceae bacterium]
MANKKVSLSIWLRGCLLVGGCVLYIAVDEIADNAARLGLDVDFLPGRIKNAGFVSLSFDEIIVLSTLLGLVGFVWAASSRGFGPIVAGGLGVIEGSAYSLFMRGVDFIGQGLSMRSFAGLVKVSEHFVAYGERLIALSVLMLGLSLFFGWEGLHRLRRVLLITGIVAAIMAVIYSHREPLNIISLVVAVVLVACAVWCFMINRLTRSV